MKKRVIIAIVALAVCFGVFRFGMSLRSHSDSLSEADRQLQDRLDKLPVLTTDDEISAAIGGAPQDYLIRNYVFSNTPAIADTVFHVLNGRYLCIYVTQETLTLERRSARAGESLYNSIWVEKPYCQTFSQFRLNDGTPIALPDSIEFIFSLWKKNLRTPDAEICDDKREHFSMSRYYPDRTVNIANPEAAAEDFISQFSDNAEKLAEEFGNKSITFGTRLNFTCMTADDEATFAARLGGGKASMSVFSDRNVIIIGSDRIPVSDMDSVSSIIYKVFGYLLMGIAALIALGILIWFVSSLFEKKRV